MPGAEGDLEPDLVLGGLKLWVFGRQFPDAHDFWDGNWLDVQARYESIGATVEVSGAILRNTDLAKFGEQCSSLYRDVHGNAVLESLEPNLFVCLRGDRHGHIAIKTRITPDHMSQRHEFQDGIDQTFLPAIIHGVGRVLQRVPVRGDPARGV